MAKKKRSRLAVKIVAGILLTLILLVFITGRISSTARTEHTFNAPVAKVWKLWNDPEAMKKWWSPEGFTAPVIKNDPRVGGKFLLSMKSPDGEMYWNAGSYTEVEENKKLVSQMAFSDATGKITPGAEVKMPGRWPDFVIVTVEFREDGDKTHVAVTEEGVPLLMKIMAQLGWEQQFVKLEKLL